MGGWGGCVCHSSDNVYIFLFHVFNSSFLIAFMKVVSLCPQIVQTHSNTLFIEREQEQNYCTDQCDYRTANNYFQNWSSHKTSKKKIAVLLRKCEYFCHLWLYTQTHSLLRIPSFAPSSWLPCLLNCLWYNTHTLVHCGDYTRDESIWVSCESSTLTSWLIPAQMDKLEWNTYCSGGALIKTPVDSLHHSDRLKIFQHSTKRN